VVQDMRGKSTDGAQCAGDGCPRRAPRPDVDSRSLVYRKVIDLWWICGERHVQSLAGVAGPLIED